MFRFTIRDVLWLTVVVGLGVAWLTDHRIQAGERSTGAAKVKMLERYLGQEGYKMEWSEGNAVLTILRPGSH
ncbi:MAG TPA: hypothetical protein VFV87_20015 [Pirellulaceae bacterium]|nr:hypothetical protein [Pirellulaceae bacterium]